jgi:hypothetical protein
MLHAVTVTPATSTTTWKCSLADEYGDVIFSLTASTQTGTVAKEVYLPVKGTYTMKLTNTSVDELFQVVLWLDNSVAP